GPAPELVFDRRRSHRFEDAGIVVPGGAYDVADDVAVRELAVVDPVRAEETRDDPRIAARGEGRAEGLDRTHRVARRHPKRDTEAARPAIHVEAGVRGLRCAEPGGEALRASPRPEDPSEQHRVPPQPDAHPRGEGLGLRRREVGERARVVEPEIERRRGRRAPRLVKGHEPSVDRGRARGAEILPPRAPKATLYPCPPAPPSSTRS